MRPNINDIQKSQKLKRVPAENNVSTNVISTIEEAFKKGRGFKKTAGDGELAIGKSMLTEQLFVVINEDTSIFFKIILEKY